MLIALKLRSREYIIYPFHITYMGNLQVFNHYTVEAFTYHMSLELCDIYDTIDVITYFTFIILYVIWYMYVYIIFKCDSYINTMCHKHIGLSL